METIIKDFKLKMILAILSGIVFSFVFILIAFVSPIKDDHVTFENRAKAKHMLEEVSRSIMNK